MSHRLVAQTENLSCHTDAKTKFVAQTRKLNLSHRLVTQTENKICHTDAKIKYVSCHTKLKAEKLTKLKDQQRLARKTLRRNKYKEPRCR